MPLLTVLKQGWNDGGRRWTLSYIGLLALTSCASMTGDRAEPKPIPEPGVASSVHQRTAKSLATPPVTTDVRSAHGSTTRPADADLGPPYRLDVENIIKLLYHNGPLVASRRERMIAAQHGLAEFKANLSRSEPFFKTTGDASHFPERRDSDALSGEITAGIEKETFDGAVLLLEGGARGEQVEFGEVGEGENEVERGEGGVIRGRVEVPFAGSRKRQERVISAAFQESTARAAVLNYLSSYREFVEAALSFYDEGLYYLDYARVYRRHFDRLTKLAADPRVKPADRGRLESVARDAEVKIEQYQTLHRVHVALLLQYLGIGQEEEYVLVERPMDSMSRYAKLALTPEGREEMLAQALDNTPKFRVLADAIKDSELKRTQAIEGRYDITAFVEGTQFAFGSETFDDRVGGWETGAGVTFRLNDRRVLDASRLKAEAEIRRYQAEIEAEHFRLEREIAVESTLVASKLGSRPQILDNIAKAKVEFEERSRIYFSGGPPPLTIDDVINTAWAIFSAEIGLASNVYYVRLSDSDLLTATGEVYRLVGMEMVDNGNGVEVPQAD